MSFEPCNVLITGGAGFIGSNFARRWLANTSNGCMLVLDALTYAGNIENLADLRGNSRFLFVQGDICDEAKVRELLEAQRIDTLINFAAESHVDRSIRGPDEFIRTNVLGTYALLKAAKTAWLDHKTVPAHRFHHVSSDEVYGSLGPRDPPFKESNRYAPNSPYSASKAASDHLVRAYHETYGLDTTTTNCSNNYGPYHFPEKLVPLTIVNSLLGKPVPIYGDGQQIRDWLHVEDHCAAIELALRNGNPGAVYNVGGNCETSNLKMVEILCGLVDALLIARQDYREAFPQSPVFAGGGAIQLITHVPDRLGHDRRYGIDHSKAGLDLGYAPAWNLRSGLESTVDWYLRHADWWQRLQSANREDR